MLVCKGAAWPLAVGGCRGHEIGDGGDSVVGRWRIRVNLRVRFRISEMRLYR